jgi:hypothetical protein
MQMGIQRYITRVHKVRNHEVLNPRLVVKLTSNTQLGYLDIVRWLCEQGGANEVAIRGEDGSSIPGVDIRSKGGWTPLSSFLSCAVESLR